MLKNDQVNKSLCRTPYFHCLMLSVRLLQTGPLRIPLWGLWMILFSAVCICWFDNPVIPPSEGDSGSANTQQHTNSWTVTAAIVPPKQCLHFDVCDAWPAEGSFSAPSSLLSLCCRETQKLQKIRWMHIYISFNNISGGFVEIYNQKKDSIFYNKCTADRIRCFLH